MAAASSLGSSGRRARARGRARRSDLRRGLAACATALALAAAAPARAQSAPPADGSAQGSSTAPGALEEIVVTAQKRAQNLQEVPIALSALAPESLALQGMNTPLGLDLTLPNVSIGSDTASGGGKGNYTIRGIGEALAQITKDQAVGIYVDDAYLPRSEGSLLLSLLDLERVEVLRGPQGTLFGRNAIGGAVHYVTRQPDFDGFSAQLRGALGSFARRDLSGWLNLPLSESLGARLSLGSLRREGHVKRLRDGHRTGDEHQLGARAQLAWRPSDALELALALDGARSRDRGGASVLSDTRADADTPRNFARDNPGAPAYTRQNFGARDFYETVGGALGRNDTRPRGLGLRADWELGSAWRLRSISSARRLDAADFEDRDESPLELDDHRVRLRSGALSQELQLLAQYERWSGVLGLYVFDEDVRRSEQAHDAQLEDAPGQVTGVYESALGVQSRAAFAQGTLALTPRLSFTAGVRHTRDAKQFRQREDAPSAERGDVQVDPEGRFDPPFDAIPIPGNRVFSWLGTRSLRAARRSERFANTTPRAVLQYAWSDDVMTYASASKGFRSGGFNDRIQIDAADRDAITDFEPEEVWSYELGLRSDWFGERLRLNASAFTSEYRDIQVSIADPARNSVAVDNGGDARLRGLELELRALLAPGLTLSGSYGYLHPEYTELAPDVTDFTKDSRFGRTPKLSAAAGLAWERALASGGALEFSASYGWKGAQRSTPQDFTHVEIGAYGLLNLRLAYHAPRERWSLALGCSNCTDEKYLIGGWGLLRDLDGPPSAPAFRGGGIDPRSFLQWVSVGQQLANPGRPRGIGIEFSARWR